MIRYVITLNFVQKNFIKKAPDHSDIIHADIRLHILKRQRNKAATDIHSHKKYLTNLELFIFLKLLRIKLEHAGHVVSCVKLYLQRKF